MMNNLVIVTALVAFAALLAVSNRGVQAGPLHHATTMAQSLHSAIAQTSEHRIRKREIYPEIMDDQPSSSVEKVPEEQSPVCVVGDLVYEIDEPVPADQPCLKCRCQPPGVHCETTRCEKKPGCRAIHKPNSCCPEYQCECDHEGRTYANGERLEQKPGTECKVCYCRGGEVQCAEVSCYIRNDCEGRHVPGKCCPKYDHCPPKEPSNIFFANEININETSKPQEITIQEIIPDIKEFPITSSPKREISEVQKETSSFIMEDTTSNVVGDSETDGSELAEVYQQPPPVLRIGDKLLFLRKGELVPEKGASTPSTIITIIGAEGLQRGGVEQEESLEHHDLRSEHDHDFRSEHDHAHENKTTLEEDEDVPLNDDEEDIQAVAESTYILSLVNRPTTSTTETSVTFDQEFNSTEGFDPDNENFTEKWSTNEGDLSSVTSSELTEPTFTSSSTSTTTTMVTPSEKEEIESNPEYPPIPDVMTQQVEETEPQLPPADHPTLPQVSNTSGVWSKKTLLNPEATLPESVLTSIAESDTEEPYITSTLTTSIITDPSPQETTQSSESDTLSTTTPGLRSMESLESQESESGENVTQVHDHASILNDESNASVEGMDADPTEDGTTAELVEMLPGYENMTVESVESLPSEVPEVKNPEDVEMVDVDIMRGHSVDEEAKNTTHADILPKGDKMVDKRESSEDDAIFQELNREIGLETGVLKEESSQEEDEKEAKQIFKELLDEATSNTTPRPVDLRGTTAPQTREQQQQAMALAKIGDALAKFQLRDSKKGAGPVDANVLGILRDFFTAQYRAYN